jgi:transcriptional regulator with XRE-family HTH domain
MGASIAKHFGEILAALRAERGLSQEELASEAGLHRTFISLVELGKRQPTLKTVFELAAALGVRPSLLVRRTEKLEFGFNDSPN